MSQFHAGEGGTAAFLFKIGLSNSSFLVFCIYRVPGVCGEIKQHMQPILGKPLLTVKRILTAWNVCDDIMSAKRRVRDWILAKCLKYQRLSAQSLNRAQPSAGYCRQAHHFSAKKTEIVWRFRLSFDGFGAELTSGNDHSSHATLSNLELAKRAFEAMRAHWG